jgi:hypothetical protein
MRSSRLLLQYLTIAIPTLLKGSVYLLFLVRLVFFDTETRVKMFILNKAKRIRMIQ